MVICYTVCSTPILQAQASNRDENSWDTGTVQIDLVDFFNRANMLYKRLGNSGVKVSNVCLGTMTFGSSERPGNCNEESSHAILNR